MQNVLINASSYKQKQIKLVKTILEYCNNKRMNRYFTTITRIIIISQQAFHLDMLRRV